ncbi:hypothetical protein [Wolbachia endosymbiont of Howardula sp.]|uniref:hypothetical protein n=1 Tax=Wolbachia endosymbiont of Howardula sp. TaxID=2916816 RepID=UPI00217DDB6A|nr:hypothetical protein [Wolbachia endosymbiont of Howardula sp.]UWI83098.1 hypothetical protein MC061_02215 [Wolbachia endosymbiont of Howardula sp.]
MNTDTSIDKWYNQKSFIQNTSVQVLKEHNSNILVGIFKLSDQYDLTSFKKDDSLFNNFGVQSILIDDKNIIHFNEKYDILSNQEIIQSQIPLVEYINSNIIDCIKEKKINRIFITIDDLSLTPTRRIILNAIMAMISHNPSIYVFGMSGAIQSILNDITSHIEPSILDDQNHQFKEIKIIPHSHLANIVNKFLIPDINGWFTMQVLDARLGSVNNTPSNRERLDLLGFTVAAFARDGSIEAIEDQYGNIYLQNHLIFFMKNIERTFSLESYKGFQSSILCSIAIMYNFLYHT